MTMRAALYARYSSDQQRAASIEDQFRVCRERAEREGWNVVLPKRWIVERTFAWISRNRRLVRDFERYAKNRRRVALCCKARKKLIDQPWKFMSIGRRQWVYGF